MKTIQVIRHLSIGPGVGYITQTVIRYTPPFELSGNTKHTPSSRGDYLATIILSVVGGLAILAMIGGRG